MAAQPALVSVSIGSSSEVSVAKNNTQTLEVTGQPWQKLQEALEKGNEIAFTIDPSSPEKMRGIIDSIQRNEREIFEICGTFRFSIKEMSYSGKAMLLYNPYTKKGKVYLLETK